MGRDHSHYTDRDPTELYLDPPPKSEARKRAEDVARRRGVDQAQLRGTFFHPSPPAGWQGLANDPIHGGSAGPVETREEGG